MAVLRPINHPWHMRTLSWFLLEQSPFHQIVHHHHVNDFHSWLDDGHQPDITPPIIFSFNCLTMVS
jgi:hypothetical protein